MANLFSFGLPTPGEVRSATNRRMFSQLPNYGGGALGQANMGAAAIGMSLGRLFGGATPEEQRAQKIQSIQTQYGELQNARGIGAPQTPEEYSAWGKGLAGELLKAGEGDYAAQVMAKLPQIADPEAKEVDNKQLNYHRNKIDKFSGDMRKIDAAYTKIKKNASEQTASGDMGIVFGIMKLLDPNSTVREGEYATAKNAAGVPERIMNLYNNAKDGQLMQEGQRQKFLSTADNLYAGQRESTDRAIENVLQQADQDAIGREKVMGSARMKAFAKRKTAPKNKPTKTIKVDW